MDLLLIPFTEAGARHLLTAECMADEQAIEVALRLTGGTRRPP
ncbi:hypothetical protein ACPEIC_20445 [Stenotrophomonas sp. NPDC087984]